MIYQQTVGIPIGAIGANCATLLTIIHIGKMK
jgi:hypothetical protein